LRKENGSQIQVFASSPEFGLWPWVRQNRDRIRQALAHHGAALLRGFSSAAGELSAIYDALGVSPLDYRDGHTPRSQVGDHVWTSTEYPASEPIYLHSEMSYASIWPKLVAFYCEVAPPMGGETPIASNAAVFRNLPSTLTSAFKRHGVLYRRNFAPGVGLSWQRAFGVQTRAELAAVLHDLDVEFAWREGVLQLSSIRPATIDHAQRGELWFNQAHAFHVAALAPLARAAVQGLGEDQYPSHAYLGDKTPIAADEVDTINKAYREAELVFRWREGDLLILDNERTAHGRRPFRGPRRVLAALCA
jgi:hypothetical protein